MKLLNINNQESIKKSAKNIIPLFRQDNHSRNHCLYCGSTKFYIGRISAQCARCESAFPLADINFKYNVEAYEEPSDIIRNKKAV